MWPFDDEEETNTDTNTFDFDSEARHIVDLAPDSISGLNALRDAYDSYEFPETSSAKAQDLFTEYSDAVRKRYDDTLPFDSITTMEWSPIEFEDIKADPSSDIASSQVDNIIKWKDDNLKFLEETTDPNYLQVRSQLKRGIEKQSASMVRDFYGSDNNPLEETLLRFGQGVVAPLEGVPFSESIGLEKATDWFTEQTNPDADDSYWYSLMSGLGNAAGAVGSGIATTAVAGPGAGAAAVGTYIGASGFGEVKNRFFESLENEGTGAEAVTAAGIEAVNQGIQTVAGERVFGKVVSNIMKPATVDKLAGKAIYRIAGSGALEGFTEGAGQVVSNYAENIGAGQDVKDLGEGVGQAAFAGLGSGSVASGVGEYAAYRKNAYSEKVKQNLGGLAADLEEEAGDAAATVTPAQQAAYDSIMAEVDALSAKKEADPENTEIDAQIDEKLNEAARVIPAEQMASDTWTTETAPETGKKTDIIPDSVIGAFPDSIETEQGAISLKTSGFTNEEQAALRASGLVQTFTSSEGGTYEGVLKEDLWEVRQERQAKSKATKTETSEPSGVKSPTSPEAPTAPIDPTAPVAPREPIPGGPTAPREPTAPRVPSEKAALQSLQQTVEQAEGTPPVLGPAFRKALTPVELPAEIPATSQLNDGTELVKHEGLLYVRKPGDTKAIGPFNTVKYVSAEHGKVLRDRLIEDTGDGLKPKQAADGSELTLSTDNDGNIFLTSEFLDQNGQLKNKKTGNKRIPVPVKESPDTGDVPIFVNKTDRSGGIPLNGFYIGGGLTATTETPGSAGAANLFDESVQQKKPKESRLFSRLKNTLGLDVLEDQGLVTQERILTAEGEAELTGRYFPWLQYARDAVAPRADEASRFVKEHGIFGTLDHLYDLDPEAIGKADITRAAALRYTLQEAYDNAEKAGDLKAQGFIRETQGALEDFINDRVSTAAWVTGTQNEASQRVIAGRTVGESEVVKVVQDLRRKAQQETEAELGEAVDPVKTNQEIDELTKLEKKLQSQVNEPAEDAKIAINSELDTLNQEYEEEHFDKPIRELEDLATKLDSKADAASLELDNNLDEAGRDLKERIDKDTKELEVLEEEIAQQKANGGVPSKTQLDKQKDAQAKVTKLEEERAATQKEIETIESGVDEVPVEEDTTPIKEEDIEESAPVKEATRAEKSAEKIHELAVTSEKAAEKLAAEDVKEAAEAVQAREKAQKEVKLAELAKTQAQEEAEEAAQVADRIEIRAAKAAEKAATKAEKEAAKVVREEAGKAKAAEKESQRAAEKAEKDLERAAEKAEKAVERAEEKAKKSEASKLKAETARQKRVEAAQARDAASKAKAEVRAKAKADAATTLAAKRAERSKELATKREARAAVLAEKRAARAEKAKQRLEAIATKLEEARAKKAAADDDIHYTIEDGRAITKAQTTKRIKLKEGINGLLKQFDKVKTADPETLPKIKETRDLAAQTRAKIKELTEKKKQPREKTKREQSLIDKKEKLTQMQEEGTVPPDPETAEKLRKVRNEKKAKQRKLDKAQQILQEKLARFTPEKRAKLTSLYNIREGLTDPVRRNAIDVEINKEMAQILPADPKSWPMRVWDKMFDDDITSQTNRNLITGPLTSLRNIFGSVVGIPLNTVAYGLRDLTVGRGTTAFVSYGKGALKTTGRNIVNAVEVIKGNRAGRMALEGNLNFQPKDLTFTNFIGEIAMRFISAGDTLAGGIGSQAMQYRAAHVASEVANVAPKDRAKWIEDRLYNTEEKLNKIRKEHAITNKALEDAGIKLTPYQKELAVYEEAESMRAKSISAHGKRHGDLISYMVAYEHGVVGTMAEGYDFMAKKLAINLPGGKKLRPLGLMIRFTRTASAVVNNLIRHTPIPLALPQYWQGRGKNIETEGKGGKMMPVLDEQGLPIANTMEDQLKTGQIMLGSALLAGVIAISEAYKDDPDPWIKFYGMPPAGSEADWRKMGLTENSVRIGGKDGFTMNLTYTPLALLPTLVQGYETMKKKGATDAVAMLNVMGTSLSAIGELGFMRSTSDLAKVITGDMFKGGTTKGESAYGFSNRLKSLGGNIAQSFIPNVGFVKNVGKWLNDADPVDTYDSIQAKIFGQMPFAPALGISQPALNVYGEKIERGFADRTGLSFIAKLPTDDPSFIWMQKTGYDIGEPSAVRAMTKEEVESYGARQKQKTSGMFSSGYADVLSPEQSREVLKIEGPRIKAYVHSIMKSPQLQVFSAETQKTITKEVNKIRAEAKLQVLNRIN